MLVPEFSELLTFQNYSEKTLVYNLFRSTLFLLAKRQKNTSSRERHSTPESYMEDVVVEYDASRWQRMEQHVIPIQVIGFFSLLVNSMGVYLVWKYSPEVSNTYKYFLLNMTVSLLYLSLVMESKQHMNKNIKHLEKICSTVLDLYLCFFMIPVPLFPLVAGYTIGLLSNVFMVSTRTQMEIFVFLIAWTCNSILTTFFYRHQVVQISKSWMKLTTLHFVIIIVSYHLGYSVPITYIFHESCLNKTMVNRVITELYPHYKFVLIRPNVQVYSSHFNPTIRIFFILVIASILLATVILVTTVTHTFQLLEQQKRHMSKATLRMHTKTTKNLVFQVSLPMLAYIIPLIVIVVIQMTQWDLPDVCSYMILLFATRSTGSTIVLIYTTKVYRERVLLFFGIVPPNQRTKVVTVDGENPPRGTSIYWTSTSTKMSVMTSRFASAAKTRHVAIKTTITQT